MSFQEAPNLVVGPASRPVVAVATALEYLSILEPFVRLPTGLAVETVLAAVDRDHVAFCSAAGRPRGFACWGLASAREAEAWLRNARSPPGAGSDGDTVVLLFVVSLHAGALRLLRDHLAGRYPGYPLVGTRDGKLLRRSVLPGEATG